MQGFANDDIHKALAFLTKNAENESFNAQALSAEYRSEESHRRSAAVYALSLKSWAISLALNMT